MHDTEPTKRASLLPLVSGLVGLLVAYAFVLSVTDQRMMAVIVAAIMGIAAYLLARIVQLRGRVTVAMAVVGFPLLMALAFTAYRHVTPFVERQKSYDNLRAAGIDFWSRGAAETGEWTQDAEGRTMPVWLADRIGPDCMDQMFSITGGLQDLQSIDYRSLDTSELRHVTIHWDDGANATDDFLSWLASLKLNGIRITHQFEAGDDQETAIRSSIALIANQVSQQRWIPEGTGWRVSYEIEGPVVLDPDAVEQLASLPAGTQLTLTDVIIDADAVRLLADHSYRSLWLRRVGLPDLSTILASPGGSLTELRFLEGKVSYDDIRRLAKIFACQRFGGESDATKEEIDSLWTIPTLEEVRVWGTPPNNRDILFERERAQTPVDVGD